MKQNYKRHKKESCVLRKNANFSENTTAKKSHQVQNVEEDGSTGTIHCKYHTQPLNDGLFAIIHDPIFINGIEMTVVPVGQHKSGTLPGKYLKSFKLIYIS